MSQFECAQQLDETDLGNWIKRYDTDVDGGLKFIDLVNALQTLTNYQPKVVSNANRQQSPNRFSMRGSTDSQPMNMSSYSGINNESREMMGQVREPRIMINDQSGDQLAYQQMMLRGQSEADSPKMVGIVKNSFVNQPTRTTGYTSAIGGHTTHMDMNSAAVGPGAISTSFNMDKIAHTGSVTPAMTQVGG